MKLKIRIIVLLCGLLITSVSRAAEKLEVPEEELARESVLPRFDRLDNVRNRNVVTAQKVEVGGYMGGNFLEPIYNQTKFGLNLGYHWSEDSALMFNFAKWSTGLNSQYVGGQGGLDDAAGLDFTRIPKLEYSLWANYELKAYYGKISLTKKGVMNLSTYPILGLGMTKYEHKSYPGLNGGIGQKFYFTPTVALRIDFKIQYQQGPNPFLKEKLLRSNTNKPSPGDFSDHWTLGNVLDIGLSLLF